ncbi:cytochrome P450 [Nonomuraea soli]|uniref:Cytochrome P450 n=1 Tax=Nonomuraea soli TaxID=1032476 RepID=A0A7W0HTD5_9ACTN|nr:cytochrome P450 [Nonomuraea soli]MBA2894925.1 cytochrome P450 [Nonomuraea soli]
MTAPAGFDPADPHTYFHRVRERCPVRRDVTPSGRVTWYLTRYADVRHALQEPALGRQVEPPGGDPLAMVRRNVFNLDPPDHTRLRRLMAPGFGARTVAVLGRLVRQRVSDLLDAMTTGEADVIADLALPLPLLVVAELLGLPQEDRARLRRWSDEMLRTDDPARVRRAGVAFLAHLGERIRERGDQTGNDLLSRLLRAERAGQLTRHELLSSVFQLLFAGDETTVNLIGNGVLELLRHPGQLRRLRERPDLIATAVEEMLRFNGPVGHSRPLHAMADLKLGGETIKRGDVVIPVLLAANRDPAAFADPDVFDIGRDPNRHLGFGHGAHFCLGAALARLQAQAAIGELLARFPRISQATEELEWTPDLFLHGVRRLPVLLESA